MASTNAQANDMLNQLGEVLHQAEQSLLDKLPRHGRVPQGANAHHDEQMTFGEHLAGTLAQFVGRWAFTATYFAVRRTEQRIREQLPRIGQVASGKQAEQEEQMAAGKRPVEKLAPLGGGWPFMFVAVAALIAGTRLIAPRRSTDAGEVAAEPARGSR